MHLEILGGEDYMGNGASTQPGWIMVIYEFCFTGNTNPYYERCWTLRVK